jgi:peptidoglycan hydrolase-like protein with peptidoglycan-binding domain
MPRIHRNEFIDTRRNQRLDVNAAKNDPAFLAKLAAAGLKIEDLEGIDLSNVRDGQLQGPAELKALFELLKGVEASGPAELLNVRATGSRVAEAFDAFDRQFTPSPGTAPVPASIDPVRRARFPITASVGQGGSNRPADVRIVQQRLKDIGFPVDVDGKYGRQTENALKAYRAMLNGTEEVAHERGLVGLNDLVDRALSMAHPPRWERMPETGPGFVNDDTDHFSYGSAETRKAIEEFSSVYAADHLSVSPGSARISLNDVSRHQGGANHDHETHENGLDLDLRLPKTNGGSGTEVGRSDYDRETAWAMIKAIASNPRVERILFTDPVLLARARTEPWGAKLQDGGRGHRNHFHVDVKPPPVD